MYIFKVVGLIFFLFTLFGCQGTNSDGIEEKVQFIDNNTTENIDINETSSFRPSLGLESSLITVKESKENIAIKILVFDEYNLAVDSGSIVVKYPDAIVKEHKNGGKFLEKEVSIVNGEAIFHFIAPERLQQIEDLHFQFLYKQNSTISTLLTIQYKPNLPNIILPLQQKNLTLNNEVVNIDIKVYDEDNNPYNSGSIKVEYPDDILSSRDIGSFQSSTVMLENSQAVFHYTAPSNLDLNTSDIVFKFYHEDNPSVKKDFTFSIVPEENQTIVTKYVLQTSLEDDVAMDLNDTKLISFFVKDKDGKLVPDNKMHSIKVSLLNSSLGILEDNYMHQATTLEIKEKNSVTLNLKSSIISGIIPIQVDVDFQDINDKNQTLSSVYNVIVMSGAPTTISLSYAGTTNNKEYAKFIDTWIVTVTDKYNNKVNTNPAVSMGLMAGYATSSAKTRNHLDFLYYKTYEGNGTLNGSNATFQAHSTLGSSNIFKDVDQNNDYLVIFGNGYNYNASGKWDIYLTNNDDTLEIVDEYNGTVSSNLGFAVGNNKREDMCEDGIEWTSNVYPENNNYIINNNGSMKINVEYDYYLAGKDVMLWVNLVGSQNTQNDEKSLARIGEAKKVTLRGMGIAGESYSFSKGFNGIVRLHIMLSDTSEFLRNSNFDFAVTVDADDANWSVVDSNMQHGGASYCYGYPNKSGISYVDVNISAGNKGSVSLTNLTLKNEF